MPYAALADMIYKCGVVVLLMLFFGAMSFGAFMLWKILSIIRHIEYSASMMVNPQMAVSPGYGPAFRGTVSKEDKAGGFVPYSESEAYINEETNNIASASNEEAINVIMEKIRMQELAKNGNSAQV